MFTIKDIIGQNILTIVAQDHSIICLDYGSGFTPTSCASILSVY